MLSKGSIKKYMTLYRVPALILVCLFAICTLLVSSHGLNSYLNIQKSTNRNYIGRTGVSYVATKLRLSNAISVEIRNTDTLIIVEEISKEQYATTIRLQDGMLTESFGSNDPDALTVDTPIVEASGFSVYLIADNLIEFTIVDKSGRSYSQVCLIAYAREGLL